MFFKPRDLEVLIKELEKIGYKRSYIAKELGVSYRTMGRWLAEGGSAPKTALLAMEFILSVDATLGRFVEVAE